MKTRCLPFMVATLLIFVIPIKCVYSQEDKVVVLDSLIREALENNPRISATYNKWQAARYRAKHVSALPDPMAKYTYFGESVETRVGPQEHKYGVSQTVPFLPKLYVKGKAALRHADMLEQEHEASKREVVREVEFAYYDIFWLDKALMILDEEKSVLENLEKVARMKFETKNASQQDAIKAGVEISKIIDKIFIINQQRKSKEAKMNNLLSRPKATPVGTVKNVEARDFTYALPELHEAASKNRQELIKSDLNIARAKYERSLSRLDLIPDFTFGFDYISVGSGTTLSRNDGDDAWMTTFGVTIPIWLDKQYAEIKEKQAALDAAKANHTDVENTVAYEIEDVYFKITTYKDIVSLYKTALLPQAKQAFESARTSYETGKVDFLNWLDSERILLQTRLAYYKAIVDYEKSISYLKRVVGTDI